MFKLQGATVRSSLRAARSSMSPTALLKRPALTPLSSIQTRRYHDNEVYGYRVASEYQMPDYTEAQLSNRMEYGSLLRMVQAYRTHGHKAAHLDPLDIMDHR